MKTADRFQKEVYFSETTSKFTNDDETARTKKLNKK